MAVRKSVLSLGAGMLLLLSFGENVLASTSCSYHSGSHAMSVTLPINGTISVGSDASDGRTLYRLHYMPSAPVKIDCLSTDSVPYDVSYDYHWTSTPHGLSPWNGPPFPGKVWDTNLPGVGVAVWAQGDKSVAIPGTYYIDTVHPQPNQNVNHTVNSEFWLYLIKTGPVQPGYVNGQDLPSMAIDFIASGASGSPLNALKINFTGSVNIAALSCTTPDVNVKLGTWSAENDFSGVGSGTEWRDASITLTNCPRAWGIRTNINANDSGITSMGNASPNPVWITMKPSTTVIDANNGIFSVTPGSDSASGVGIQIAKGNVSDASHEPMVLNTYNNNYWNLSTDDVNTHRIPFVARYVQTEDRMRPGKANGAITFTVLYY
ncbi:fimbrial protein [Cronobacter malonaticus]|nr:fimbrial protein [Cronobacter malonaticus]MDI6461581.1 fimbrial protein [Cronobacter malonaticus]MDI6469989.1 fimbrial protein [Cronobacter malonaticus]MDK1178558.1 fimbrial protein [Cronobacter malonaticus]